ncbi:MAG: DUF5615 family PIN-like protein [Planctomycetaceae bacterium]|nr:DUF5615 family PIN-like protein [Planctomycetaceae bacterium]
MRFHLDEHVNSAIARGLLLRGIDVSTSVGAGLLGASDQEQFVYAMGEQRVIYTNDCDFHQLARSGVHHAGIVYSPRHSASVGQVIRYLCFLHETLTSEDMIDRVEYLFVI